MRSGLEGNCVILRQAGITVVELLVVLLLLGTISGITAIALRRNPREDPQGTRTEISEARHRAIMDQRSLTVTVQVEGREVSVTLSADGTVAADSALGVNPLTGRPLPCGLNVAARSCSR